MSGRGQVASVAMLHNQLTYHPQEMEQILEHIHANRADTNAQSDDFDQHKLQQSAEDGGDAPDSEAEGDLSQASKQKRLQIMVFSATLTLPLHLRKRLNKSKPGLSTCVFLLLLSAVMEKLVAFAIIYLTFFGSIWSVLDNAATATLLFCVVCEAFVPDRLLWCVVQAPQQE